MIGSRIFRGVLSGFLAVLSLTAHADDAVDRPLVLAHYMPWYEGPPVAERWGWHWTMNVFETDKPVDGRRPIASHYYPEAGPYDSGDKDVLEYQLLLMKLAGIDGVIVDWYGLQEFRDYPILHRNTALLIEQASSLGMKFVICYEDQTIPALVKAERVGADQQAAHAASEIAWLAKNWFPLEGYVRLQGKPVLLSFGQTGLSDEEWTACLSSLKSPVAYFSQHFRRTSAVGAFDWPSPSSGIVAVEQFEERSAAWETSIPVVFPRFVDIYKEAKLHDSYGRIEDQNGATFRTTLDRALRSKAKLIQIATWNDWGEGTVIEPSREFGNRDLETLQSRRREIDASFQATPADLLLVDQLLKLRRRSSGKPNATADRIRLLLASQNLPAARRLLAPFQARGR